MAGSHDEFGVRALKGAAEVFARKGGATLGQSHVPQAMGRWLNNQFGAKAAHWAASAAGIAGGAALQAPNWLVQGVESITGWDHGVSESILNEMIDQGTQQVALEVDKASARGTTLTEADKDSIYKRHLGEMLSQGGSLYGQLADLSATARVIVTRSRTIHDMSCPDCYRTAGARRGAQTSTDRLLDGNREVTIEWAIDNQYRPTQNSCCRNAVEDRMTAYKRRPRTINECVAALRTDVPGLAPVEARIIQTRYTTLVAGLSGEQQKLLRTLDGREWQPEFIALALQGCLDTNNQPSFARFSAILQSQKSPEPPPTPASRFRKLLQDFTKGVGSPDIKRARAVLGVHASKMRRTATTKQTAHNRRLEMSGRVRRGR